MANSLIDLQNVSLTLSSRAGPVDILKRVDVEIAPGESVAVVGPSGSGKTSLLMIIAGLEGLNAGSPHRKVIPTARTLEVLQNFTKSDDPKIAALSEEILAAWKKPFGQ